MKRFRINWSLGAGLALGLGIIGMAVFHSASTPWIFMNVVGLLVVVGGMAAASLIMYPFEDLRELSRAVLACGFQLPADRVVAIRELVNLGQLQSEDPLFFSWKADGITHLLICLLNPSSPDRAQFLPRRGA